MSMAVSVAAGAATIDGSGSSLPFPDGSGLIILAMCLLGGIIGYNVFSKKDSKDVLGPWVWALCGAAIMYTPAVIVIYIMTHIR